MFARDKFEIDPSRYEGLDSYWKAAVDFLRAHVRPDTRLIVPPAMTDCFPGQGATYDAAPMEKYEWLVLHKGLISDPAMKNWIPASRFLEPVFANEVFVIFTRQGRLKPISQNDIHYQSFMKSTESKLEAASTATSILPVSPPLQDPVPEASKTWAQDFVGIAPRLVTAAFREMLARDPNPEEMQSHADRLVSDNDISGFLALILGSAEYKAKIQPPPAAEPKPPHPAIYLGDHKVLTKTVHGHKIYVDTRDRSLAPHLMLSGEWENWITAIFIQQIKAGDTVIEVGANCGYYTLLACSLVGPAGKVYAFEANADLCHMLFKSIEINGFLDRCEIINKAVSDSEGVLTLSKWTEHLGSSSVAAVHTKAFAEIWHDSVEAVPVESTSLDTFILQRGIENVSFIKIDAEGSEPKIFDGLKSTFDKMPSLSVIFEFAPKLILALRKDPAEYLDNLMKMGFRMDLIDPAGLIAVNSGGEIISKQLHDILMRRIQVEGTAPNP